MQVEVDGIYRIKPEHKNECGNSSSIGGVKVRIARKSSSGSLEYEILSENENKLGTCSCCFKEKHLEENNGLEVASASTTSISQKFKVGDTVRCVLNNNNGNRSNEPGAGWAEGKEFIINNCVFVSEQYNAYFPKEGNGVYEDYLILAADYKQLNTNNSMALSKKVLSQLSDADQKLYNAGFVNDDLDLTAAGKKAVEEINRTKFETELVVAAEKVIAEEEAAKAAKASKKSVEPAF